MGCTLTCLPLGAADAAHPITTSTVSEWWSSVRRVLDSWQAYMWLLLPWTLRQSVSYSNLMKAGSAIIALPLNGFLM